MSLPKFVVREIASLPATPGAPYGHERPRRTQKAHDRFGGPKNLLRGAAKALGESIRSDQGDGPQAAGDNEISRLAQFARESGLTRQKKPAPTRRREYRQRQSPIRILRKNGASRQPPAGSEPAVSLGNGPSTARRQPHYKPECRNCQLKPPRT